MSTAARVLRRVIAATIVSIFAVPVCADPKAEVTDAVQRLAEAPNYSWEVRHARLEPDRSPGLRSIPVLNASLTLRIAGGLYESGMIDEEGLAVIKVHAAERVLGGPQVVVSRGSRDRIAETPRGWLTAIEVRSALSEAGGETVEANGRRVLLRDALFEAGKALSAIRPDLQLPLLVADIESFTRVGKYIVGELSEAGRSRRSGRYPSSDQPVTAVFQVTHGQLDAYFVSNFRIVRSMSGVVVVIKNVGSTSVAAPQEAFDKLMR